MARPWRVPCGGANTTANKGKDRIYRYYVCYKAQKQGWDACPCRSLPAEQIEGFVVDQIKRIGKDPALLSLTLSKCRQQLTQQRAEAERELGLVERELARLHADLCRTAGVAATDGDAAARLADLHQRVQVADDRAAALRREIADADAGQITKAEVDAALGEFDGVWSRLSPKEQAKLMRMLVQRVDYQYKFAEYRDSRGRFVAEVLAKQERASIWVYRESDWTIMSSENKQSASTRDPNHPNYRFYEVVHPVTGKVCSQPTRGWKGTRMVDPAYPDRNSLESLLRDHRIAFGDDESKVPQQKRFLHEVSTNVQKSVIVDYSDGEKQTLAMFGKAGVFLAPKHSTFVKTLIRPCCRKSSMILDCFGGSGSTAQAVVELNREDGGTRQFVLVETNAYYHTLIRPRVAKMLFSPKWRKGVAESVDVGLSGLVKCFALESYEDALNNLPAPSGSLLDGRSAAEKDALITYGLDLELGPHLLNMDAFRDPWGYTINAQLAGDAEIKRHRVDLVETFNYLIGLKVHAYGPLERYSADFERAAHADGLGRMKLTGRLRRDANGPFVFQRVEGELNDGNSTRVLVVWRKLTDDPEKDAAVLDAWMARHRESTRERTEHRNYHLIYINGPDPCRPHAPNSKSCSTRPSACSTPARSRC